MNEFSGRFDFDQARNCSEESKLQIFQLPFVEIDSPNCIGSADQLSDKCI